MGQESPEPTSADEKPHLPFDPDAAIKLAGAVTASLQGNSRLVVNVLNDTDPLNMVCAGIGIIEWMIRWWASDINRAPEDVWAWCAQQIMRARLETR